MADLDSFGTTLRWWAAVRRKPIPRCSGAASTPSHSHVWVYLWDKVQVTVFVGFALNYLYLVQNRFIFIITFDFICHYQHYTLKAVHIKDEKFWKHSSPHHNSGFVQGGTLGVSDLPDDTTWCPTNCTLKNINFVEFSHSRIIYRNVFNSI